MLSPELTHKLNEQITLELYTAQTYLQMSAWCAYNTLDGCATFLTQRADEEAMHGRKLLDYVSETGGLAIIGAIAQPRAEYANVRELFQTIYQHEMTVTQKINELVRLADDQKDYATLQFLQWYVAEQHQEEFLFKSIVDRIDMIGLDGQGLYFVDKEIGRLAAGEIRRLSKNV